MNYSGVIIEESLEDKRILEEVKVTGTKIEQVTDEHKTPWVTQWTLHTVEIPEVQAERTVEKVSRALDPKHAWYADFKNETHHYIIFRDKVFHVDRKSKEQYGEARQYGLSLGIPEYQLLNYQGIPKDVLAHFLREAHENTFASKDAPKALPSRPASKDYHFEKDDLAYHDTFFGDRSLIGEEIIYQDQKPVWGANYFGSIVSDDANESEVYDFLREALMQSIVGLMPVRGPSTFSRGDWDYRFSAQGDLSNFSGQEEIQLNKSVVYRCLVHGGFVQ